MNATASNPVGRPRSFDEEEVLAAVMDVFWRKGYEATTMADILAATGLHKGSIYQTFGDKHTLFVRALRSYVDNMRSAMTDLLAGADSAVEGLRAGMYHHIALGARKGGGNFGCMALNSLVEFAQHDPEVLQVLGNAYAMRMKLITATVARAQAQGDLRSDWPAERIANLIAAGEAGIVVELKGMLDETGAQRMVDDLLETLG